jgi:hypothetical protein
MATGSGEQPAQAFRDISTNAVIKIPALKDRKSGEHIVLWSDVQRVFKNAEFIRNEGSLVLFMKNEDFSE